MATTSIDLNEQQSQLKILIAKGKEQGYLTYSEVNDHLPDGIVEPEQIGRGVGGALIAHARERARQLGGARLIIQGDPHAEGFYLAAGGKKSGSRESESVPGRRLPLFVIDLDDERGA